MGRRAAKALSTLALAAMASVAPVSGCERSPSTLELELDLDGDDASARRCPEGQTLNVTVVREWGETATVPRVALHASSPTPGTWWIEEVTDPDTGILDTARLVFASDDSEAPSITATTPWWDQWVPADNEWKLYQDGDDPAVWAVPSSAYEALRVCRTDPTVTPPETTCGYLNTTSNNSVTSWQRALVFVESVPWAVSMKRYAVPFDTGFYCTNNLAGTSEDAEYPLVEIPVCLNPISEGISTLELSGTALEGQLFFDGVGGSTSAFDAGAPVSMEAARATGANGQYVLLTELGAGFGVSYPHMTRMYLDANGSPRIGDVTSGPEVLPVPTDLTVPWTLQFGETPSEFVIAQIYAREAGGYHVRLYFADTFDLTWKAAAVERVVPPEDALILPLLLQLENFPIVVAVVEGQLQRVDGATSPQPLVSAPDAVSMEQAGRGHLLLRRDDDTATLLRVACDPVEAP